MKFSTLGSTKTGIFFAAAKGRTRLHQGGGDDPLVVVRDDDAGRVLFLQEADDLRRRRARNGLLLFLVDADDLLLMGDDPHLDGRRPPGLDDDAARLPKVALDPGALLVVADDADEKRDEAQALEVPGDVARPAQAGRALPDLDDRDRRLGRDARDVAPDVAVEHDVAEDDDALARELADDPAGFSRSRARVPVMAHLPKENGLEMIQGTPGRSGVRSRRWTSTR